jgi:predicted transcriptional regulator
LLTLFLLFHWSQRGIPTGKECLLNQSREDDIMMNQNKNVRAEMFYLRGYSVQVQVITAAVNLKLADCIGDDRCSIAEQAQSTGCDESVLRRLLRALTCIGIFREEGVLPEYAV